MGRSPLTPRRTPSPTNPPRSAGRCRAQRGGGDDRHPPRPSGGPPHKWEGVRSEPEEDRLPQLLPAARGGAERSEAEGADRPPPRPSGAPPPTCGRASSQPDEDRLPPALQPQPEAHDDT